MEIPLLSPCKTLPIVRSLFLSVREVVEDDEDVEEEEEADEELFADGEIVD